MLFILDLCNTTRDRSVRCTSTIVIPQPCLKNDWNASQENYLSCNSKARLLSLPLSINFFSLFTARYARSSLFLFPSSVRKKFKFYLFGVIEIFMYYIFFTRSTTISLPTIHIVFGIFNYLVSNFRWLCSFYFYYLVF